MARHRNPSGYFEHQIDSGRWIKIEERKTEDGGVVGIRTDITAIKHAEQSILAEKERSDQASQAKSEFLASMSHELRTPLNAILGYGQMLQLGVGGNIADTQKSYVEHIVSSGNHLLALINDILDLARIEADRLQVVIENFEPVALIDESVSQLELYAEEKGIGVALRNEIGSGVMVKSDRARLRQILINLISNAIKYNRPDGRVIVQATLIGSDYLRISVIDTGIGISDDLKNKVFDLFETGSPNSMLTTEGYGIGLAVSKNLAERLGGRINFTSHPEQGSTFWVDVPLASNDTVLIWTEEYKTGIDPIDKDHQVIFKLANQVAVDGLTMPEMAMIISDLINYTSYHFRREEAIMEACGYPALDEHKRKHHRLEAHVIDLKSEWLESGSGEMLLQLRELLRAWWSAHIMDVDKTIVKHAAGREREIQKAIAELR